MGDYNVSKIPIDTMTECDILSEADELRTQLAVIESELSKRQAWDRAEQKGNLHWLANTRTLRALLVSRYMRIKPVEKRINRKIHSKRRGTTAEELNHDKSH